MRLGPGRAGTADTTATTTATATTIAGKPPVTAWQRYTQPVDRRISGSYKTNFRSGNMPITTDGW